MIVKPPMRRPARVQAKDRDEGHLEGHDHQPDDDDEHRSAPRELHPRERIGRERGDGDRDDGRRYGDGQAVQEGVAEALGVEGGPVVLECPLPGIEGVGEDRPPAGAC